jgi:drug/metabolite transporter (DMT)-like permease
MNAKQLQQAITIFVVFLVAGILMIVLPYNLDLDQSRSATQLQAALPLIGSALISSGLTFFLIEVIRLDREEKSV